MFPSRTLIKGSAVKIRPQNVQKLTLVLHELMTNAVKYGALSGQNGTVSVSWTVARNDATPILKFRWEERGGPPVTAPARQGLGSLLIKTSFPNARLDFGERGLTCEIELPAVPTNTQAQPVSRPEEANSLLA